MDWSLAWHVFWGLCIIVESKDQVNEGDEQL